MEFLCCTASHRGVRVGVASGWASREHTGAEDEHHERWANKARVILTPQPRDDEGEERHARGKTRCTGGLSPAPSDISSLCAPFELRCLRLITHASAHARAHASAHAHAQTHTFTCGRIRTRSCAHTHPRGVLCELKHCGRAQTYKTHPHHTRARVRTHCTRTLHTVGDAAVHMQLRVYGHRIPRWKQESPEDQGVCPSPSTPRARPFTRGARAPARAPAPARAHTPHMHTQHTHNV